MNRLVLVDFSTLARRCWHSMKAPGQDLKAKTEKEFFWLSLHRAAIQLRTRFSREGDFILICADSTNSWRKQYWERTYHTEAISLGCTDGDTTCIPKDGFWYTTTRMSDGNNTPWQKMSKEQTDYMEAKGNGFEYGAFDKHQVEEIKRFVGTYKGRRKVSEWTFSTPKSTMKEWIRLVAPAFAGLVGGGFAMVDDAEADDIIAYAVRNCPEGYEPWVISTDQDIAWSEEKGVGQLQNKAVVCTAWDKPPHKRVVEHEVLQNAVSKVLLGDSGDDIGPCMTVTNKRITPKMLPKLIAQMEEGDMSMIDPLTWERNHTLIWLRDEGPMDVEIKAELEDPFKNVLDVPAIWKLPMAQILLAQSAGRSMAAVDRNKEQWL